VIVIVGAPGTGAWGSQRVIHHSLGKAGDLDFELHCFEQASTLGSGVETGPIPGRAVWEGAGPGPPAQVAPTVE
jgi:hypothetical protein